MKKCKKLLAFTLSVLLAFACYVVPAFALSSASQYGLEATLVTDKESYKANEEIHVTVTVKNTNDFKVEAVSIESLLPETLTLKDGSNSTKTVDLEPGETLTLSFTAVKEKEETSATEPTETEPVLPSESETVKPSESESVKPTIGTINTAIDDSTTVFPKEVTEMNSATIIHSNNPNTGDISSIKTVVIAIIAVLALIAIILILLHKHQKQTTKIISLVMCIAVATTAITGVSFFTAKGTDDGRKSFTVEKVITVDGEETNVSAEVKYQENKINPDTGIEFIYFTTSEPIDVLVGEKTVVTFEAKISNPQSISLDKIQVIDEAGNEVGFLYDNGMKPDKTINDGIYTGAFELYSQVEKKVKYYAQIEQSKSKPCEIFYYTNLKMADWYEYQSVCDDTLKIQKKYLNIEGYVDDDKLDMLLAEVSKYAENKKGTGEISYYEKGNDSVYMKLKSGISYLFVPQRYGRLSSGSHSQIVTIEPSALSYGVWLNRILSWIDATFNDLEYKGPYTVTGSAALLKGTNLGYSYSLNNTFIDNQVTIDSLKTLGENKVIIWEGHGAYSNELHSCLVTGENVNAWKSMLSYSADLKGDRIALTSGILGTSLGSQYAITSAFVDHYVKQMDNSLVFLGACYSGKDDVLPNAFLNKGAKSVLAFNNSTSMEYEMLMRTYIFYLLSSHEKYGRFCTVQEALDEAKKVFGTKDRYTNDTEENLAELNLYNKNAGDSFSAADIVKVAGGNGTIDDPYQISNAQQLNAVRYNLKSNFVLTNDIDLSGYNWVPISKFSGSLDGKGHTIKNLKIDYVIENKENKLPESYGVGLFDGIKDSSKIKNINLKAIDINIKNNVKNRSFGFAVGGITSTCENSLIDNCTVSGKIKINDENTYAKYAVAGVCGIADKSSINNCINKVDINVSISREGHADIIADSNSVGGISSDVYNSSILNCINEGDIYVIANRMAELSCGGIAGSSYNLQESTHLFAIKNCKNYGDVKALGGDTVLTGGIIAASHMSIDSNINYGNISSYAYGGAISGGITGYVYSPHSQSSIKKCINYGNITSEILTSTEILFSSSSFAGGIVGSLPDMDIFIEQCYNAGSKIVANNKNSSDFYINRICGDCFISSRGAPILNCYSLDTTTLNGSIPTEDIGPDQKNGGSMTKAEIEKAIQELGFELPGELPAAS